MAEHYLQGGCSCGRNQYEIVLPPVAESRDTAQVVFGETKDIRQAFASALPTLLKVPLPWLQSTTYAFFDDERPSDIRRVFSPSSAPHTKRNFCGFCGTSLSFWTESSREEAEFICVNLGSLERESLNLLDTLGLLPSASDDENDGDAERTATVNQGQASSQAGNAVAGAQQDRVVRGQPWFEELIETGPLGRLKRIRGGHTSSDGSAVVEWEVVEVNDGDDGVEAPSKRIMTADGDILMRGD